MPVNTIEFFNQLPDVTPRVLEVTEFEPDEVSGIWLRASRHRNTIERVRIDEIVSAHGFSPNSLILDDGFQLDYLNDELSKLPEGDNEQRLTAAVEQTLGALVRVTDNISTLDKSKDKRRLGRKALRVVRFAVTWSVNRTQAHPDLYRGDFMTCDPAEKIPQHLEAYAKLLPYMKHGVRRYINEIIEETA
jgi:hypothetical protein